ncbi:MULTISPECIES: 4-alpha-glucanotransferase [unclassified Streptomyces]|uniref:4-alpha-glucanotransferase n=1 Tax=unclassified Streptomyces TaxID=2593676 RepID=UPI000DC78B46|nr:MULTISPECIES: 4-alpha-glucanotransferase [unclassified Streptomyces]AWZ09303.1 4-alpha-glucanotransferase [Streptomyces sp. ICC4]AWZ17041.1 4-alpha-glucanotransferase [Streptomyces sp. ICC1]
MDDLARLAALNGVATTYQPAEDVTVRVPESTVAAVLRRLGADTDTPESVRAHLAAAEHEAAQRLLPRVLVWWAGSRAPAELGALPPGTRIRLDLEDGGVTEAAAGSPGAAAGLQEAFGGPPGSRGGPSGQPPLGVHRMRAEAPDGRTATATLIVAPDRAPAAPGRTHGLLVQLYSLLSERSWGMGDLGDLAELARWAGRVHGAGFIQVNPLHAAVPGTPTDPSPYRPSSRRFPDPVHLRIEDVPECAAGPNRAALTELADRGGELRREVLEKGALIDRDAVWALKRAALELLYAVPRTPEREAAYGRFRAEQGAELDRHAAWCAAHAGEDPQTRADFHRWLVWLTDTQLVAAQRAAKEAGMAVGIVHDLAVGVHPEGSDASGSEHYAEGVSVGAPPDAFNARGQDWGLPPWRPDRLAAGGYEPFRALLRGVFRYAGALRIDHVMGLFRLWWIPEGAPPAEGAYVSYDGEAMLALLVLEAHRAGALVIGEDLGTVQPGVRQALARRGVLGTSVLWFERDWGGDGEPLEAERWRSDCLATATTHDLPPTAAKLAGAHVELRDRLGLLTRPLERERAEDAADTARWLDVLEDLGLDTKDEEAAVRALYGFLLRTPARLVGVWLPDAVGDRRPQNLPGTWDQYPNWRLPVADAEGRPLTLEALAASPRANSLLSAVRDGG